MNGRNNICPICGEVLRTGRSPGRPNWASPDATQLVGGWVVCAHHQVFIRPSKFTSRCHECLGPIFAGEDAVLCPPSDKGECAHGGRANIGGSRWTVLHLRDRCGVSPRSHGGDAFASSQSAESGGAYSKLYLLPGAPVEVVRAAYKALAMRYHPDRPGGDAQKMRELNEAVAEIVDEN